MPAAINQAGRCFSCPSRTSAASPRDGRADAEPGHPGLAQASFRRPLSRPSSRYSGQNPLLAVAAMIAAKTRATTAPTVPARTAIASQTAAAARTARTIRSAIRCVRPPSAHGGEACLLRTAVPVIPYAAAAAERRKVVPTLFWRNAPGRRRAIAWVAFQPVQ